MIRVPEGKIEKLVAEEGRGGIEHVYFDGKNLVATDGHILAILPAVVEEGSSPETAVPGMVPVAAIAQARAEYKENKYGVGPFLALRDGAAVSLRGASFTRPDDKFPPWQQSIGGNYYTDEGAIAVTINPALLATLVEGLGGNGKSKRYASTVTLILPKGYSGEQPIRVTVENSEGYGVIMPIRLPQEGANPRPKEEKEAVAVAA